MAEQLEFVPASFPLIRHVRPKLACGCCDAIVQAQAPSRPIARGLAGPGVLACWVGAASALLPPLLGTIPQHILPGAKLYADDTPPAVWFAYSPDRKGINPQSHLAQFNGMLKAAACAGLNTLYENGDIQEAAW